MADAADQSSHNDTLKEIEELLKDDSFFLFPQPSASSRTEHPLQSSRHLDESCSLSTVTTPDPLNTAFINETNDFNENNQKSVSCQSSQTTNEAAIAATTTTTPVSSIDALPDKVTGKEYVMIYLGSRRRPTMISRGTMTKTPIKMVSIGTMPKTPTTTTVSSPLVPVIETIDLCSPDIPPTNIDSPNSTPNMAPPS